VTTSAPPAPERERVRFGWCLARGFAWGMGVTFGVLAAVIVAYLVLGNLIVAATDDRPRFDLPVLDPNCPEGLEGTGACDGRPGALGALR
jgi:hypothetical protein